MQKITVVGESSAAKNAVIISLNSTLKIIDFLPEEVSTNNVGETDLVIYVTELHPDRQIFERLRTVYGGLILISRTKLRRSDFYLSDVNFHSLATKEVLKEIQSMRDFIDKFFSSRAELNDIQLSVINQLFEGSGEREVLSALSISRRTYYSILSELRSLYGVSKNWQLIQRIQNMKQNQRG
jgi:hypothetical protein